MAMNMPGYSGAERPRMLMIGEAWGADEDKMKLPLVGASGKIHWKMLGEALPDVHPELHAEAQAEINASEWGLAWVRKRDKWLDAAGVGFTNVLNMRPPNNDMNVLCGSKTEVGGANYPYPAIYKGRYLRSEYFPHLERLAENVAVLKPNICCLMGNTACWAVLGSTNITAVRGSATWSDTYQVKCLPTFHPASLIYEGQWGRRPIIIADYMKAYREGESAELKRPSRKLLINPTLAEVAQWVDETIADPPYVLTVDVETSGGMIDTCGFSRSPSDGFVIPFGPHRVKRGAGYTIIYPERDGKRVTSYWTVEEEVQVWNHIERLMRSNVSKAFQNGLYDIQYLMKVLGIPNNCEHDTMLAWHALYPELPKSLGFLGSVLTNDVAWKQFRTARSDTEKRDE